MPIFPLAAIALVASLAVAVSAAPSLAKDRAEIDRTVVEARALLLEQQPGVEDILRNAKGVLIIPEVVKGGLISGGSYGEGALLEPDEAGEFQTVGYYSVAVASLGLQIGVERSSQAIFFMTDEALRGFRNADGWTAGVDASVTLLEKGFAANMQTATRGKPIVAIVFGQKGFLAGASLEGAKYSPIVRD